MYGVTSHFCAIMHTGAGGTHSLCNEPYTNIARPFAPAKWQIPGQTSYCIYDVLRTNINLIWLFVVRHPDSARLYENHKAIWIKLPVYICRLQILSKSYRLMWARLRPLLFLPPTRKQILEHLVYILVQISEIVCRLTL